MRARRRRPPLWLLAGTVVAIGAVVALLGWPTSGGARRPVPLRAADVPTAVAALETRLGGAQRYTEINATIDGVNLFVAADGGNEVPWYYRAAALEGPSSTQPAGERVAFTLDGVALARAERVARTALDKFPTAQLTQFALLRLPDAGVVWSVSLQSSRGGRIDVSFTPAGELLGAELR